MKKSQVFSIVCGLLMGLARVFSDPVVVYDMNAVGVAQGAVADTQKGLTVNLPGGMWSPGGGWEWAHVHMTGTSLNLGEEHAMVCLPLFNEAGFECPAALTLTAMLHHSQGSGGIGFFPETVPPSIMIEDKETGAKEYFRYNGRRSFTGILLDQAIHNNKPADRPTVMRLAVDGEFVGDPVEVVLSGGKFDKVSFSVNLVTGELLAVYLNEELVQGFPETTAFTGDAVQYVGLVSWTGGRTEASTFSVAEADLVPHPELFVEPTSVMVYTNSLVRVNARARRTDTREALPVTLFSFDGEGATFSDGIFQWTAVDPGVYTATFETELDEEIVQASATITVLEPPPIDVSIIYEVNAEGPYNGAIENTDMGIVTNQPGALWAAGGGWNWANVRAVDNCINLGEEKACAYLPVFNTNGYIRPTTLTISATLDDWDRDSEHGIGFWSTAIPRSKEYPEAGGVVIYNAMDGFSGILINQIRGTAQLVTDGQKKGSPVPIDPSGKLFEKLLFTIDTSTGELLYATYNDERIFDLPATTHFTESATQYAGVMSWQGGRASFQRFSLMTGKPAPRVPVMTISPRSSSSFAGDEVTFSVTAVDPETRAPVAVALSSFEGGESATFADGVLRWTPTHPGLYTAVFRAEIDGDVCEKALALEVLPLIPVYELSSGEASGLIGQELSLNVVARNPSNGTNLTVRVSAFDGEDYRFEQGAFTSRPTATGAYWAEFTTELATPYGTEVVVTNVPFMVFEKAQPCLPESFIYQTDFTGLGSDVKLAGNPIGQPETRTKLGLGVNVPDAAWIWGAGYNWGVPQTRESGTKFDLGENVCAILLPIADTNSYVRPAEILVATTFSSLVGNGLVGFWSGSPYEVTANDTKVYEGFTGFRFNTFTHELQLVSSGEAVGDSVFVPFDGLSRGLEFSFVLNAEKGYVHSISWDGFAIEGFADPIFTEKATPFVGFGLGDAVNNPQNVKSSGRISAFEVSKPKPRGMLILFR